MTTLIKASTKEYVPSLSDFEIAMTTNEIGTVSEEIESKELRKSPSFMLIHPRFFTMFSISAVYNRLQPLLESSDSPTIARNH